MTDDSEPLMEPHIIELLKDRPRLLDYGVREELLEELANNIRERRKPDRFAEKVVQNIMQRTQEVSEPVARRRAQKRVKDLNQRFLKRI